MSRRVLTRIDLYVAAWGLALTLGALALYDLSTMLGVLVGASVATANWMAFRWLGIRMAATGNKNRFGVFLGVKTVAILAIVGLLLTTNDVIAPLPFMIGMSSLVLGILSRGAHQAIAEGDAVLREDG